MPALAKPLLRSVLAALLDVHARLSAQPRALVLLFHAIGPRPGDEAAELVPALAPETFAMQVGRVRRRYRAVPASELRTAAAQRRRGQRIPVAITFDDDLSCHLDEAAPVLRAAGPPATFYLTGATLDGPHRFWWELLEALWPASPPIDDALRRHGVAADDLHAVARKIGSLPPARRDALTAELEAFSPPAPPDAGLRRAQVATLAAGYEVGFHNRRLGWVRGRPVDGHDVRGAPRRGGPDLRARARSHGQRRTGQPPPALVAARFLEARRRRLTYAPPA